MRAALQVQVSAHFAAGRGVRARRLAAAAAAAHAADIVASLSRMERIAHGH
jgi:hypothetical protein